MRRGRLPEGQGFTSAAPGRGPSDPPRLPSRRALAPYREAWTRVPAGVASVL